MMESRWEITQDFKTDDVAYYLCHRILAAALRKREDQRKDKVKLTAYFDGSISIQYFDPSNELFNLCIQDMAYDNFTQNNDRTNTSCVGLDKSTDKKKILGFIDRVDREINLDEIKQDILDCVEHHFREIHIPGIHQGRPSQLGTFAQPANVPTSDAVNQPSNSFKYG